MKLTVNQSCFSQTISVSLLKPKQYIFVNKITGFVLHHITEAKLLIPLGQIHKVPLG